MGPLPTISGKGVNSTRNSGCATRSEKPVEGREAKAESLPETMFLTREQLAEVLQVSLRTVERMMEDEEISSASVDTFVDSKAPCS